MTPQRRVAAARLTNAKRPNAKKSFNEQSGYFEPRIKRGARVVV